MEQSEMVINPINRGINGRGQKAYYLNIEKEKLEAQLTGQKPLSVVKASLIVSIFINLIIGTPLTSISTLFTYLFLLNSNNIKVNVSVTKERVIRQYVHKNKKMRTLILIFFLLLESEHIWQLFFYSYNSTTQNYFGLFLFSLFIPRIFIDFVLPIFNVMIIYQLPQLPTVGNILLMVIHFVVGAMLIKYNHSIEETHIRQISEIQIVERKVQSRNTKFMFGALITVAVMYNIYQFPIEQPIRYVGLLGIIVYYLLSRNEEQYTIQLVNRAGRKLQQMIIIHSREKMQVRRLIATIFQLPIVDTTKRKFPQNMISEGIANIIPTGLERKEDRVFRQADAVVYVIAILLILTYSSIWFTHQQKTIVENLITIILIGFLLLVITYIMQMLRKELVKPKNTEFFIVGSAVQGYYKKSNLWLARIDVTSGMTLGKRIHLKFFNYSRIMGIRLAWKTTIMIMLVGFSALIFTQWFRFGAINIKGTQLLLTYYLNKALTYAWDYIIENPYTLLVIITVIWQLLYLIYPRLYKYFLSRLNLDLKQKGDLTILFEDKDSFLNAYQELSKLQLETTHEKKNYVIGRPSAFMLNILVTAGDNADRIISIGDRSTRRFLMFDKSNTAQVRLMVSARTGYPKLIIKEWNAQQQQDSKSVILNLSLEATQYHKIELSTTFKLQVEISKILS